MTWTYLIFKVEKLKTNTGITMLYMFSNEAIYGGQPILTYPNPFFSFDFEDKPLEIKFGKLRSPIISLILNRKPADGVGPDFNEHFWTQRLENLPWRHYLCV